MPEDDKGKAVLEIYYQIQNAYVQDILPELLGKALGKTAVVVLMADLNGGFEVFASCAKDRQDTARNQSMITQIADLLTQNMDSMMKIAGKTPALATNFIPQMEAAERMIIKLSCLMCGSDDLKLLRTLGSIRDHRCNKCGQEMTEM